MTAAGIGYTAAVIVAAVFAVAGAVKLRDVPGTADDFEALGVPRPPVASVFVPVAELSVTALLLLVPAAGAIGALVTLAFFTTFLVGRLRAGVRTPCACFGSARRDPLSAVEVARNLGLMLLSGVALATDRPARPTAADLAVVLVPVSLAALGLRVARSRVRASAD
jgi:uncharacterized membrane protein YphA (DoxX/SURF4 family)